MSERRNMRSKSENKMPSPLGRRLYQLRYDANIPQRELAEYLNISRSAYSYYELGTVEPSLPVLRRIADFYSLNVTDLLSEPKPE